MRLLDTDICIDLLRNYPQTVQWFSTLAGPVALPGYVALELYQGCHNKQEVHEVDVFLSRFSLIWPNEADYTSVLTIYPSLRLSHSLGLLDALIGACALGSGAILCTFNIKHFQAIPALLLEQPYSKTP